MQLGVDWRVWLGHFCVARRAQVSWTHWTVLVGVLAVLPVGVLTQSSSEATPAPRTSWGAPDLRGIWSNDTLTPLQRPEQLGDKEFYSDADLRGEAVQQYVEDFFPEEERAISGENTAVWMEPGALGRRTSLLVGPTGRVPPLTPAAKKRRDTGTNESRFDSFEGRPFGERCLRHGTGGPPMLPLPFVNLVHVFQTPNHVVFLHEESHEIRIIPLDGRPGASPTIRLWRGDSRGKWDGDTLVVETTNFRAGVVLRGSDGLQLTERLRRVGADALLYEFTVTDPVTFTESWTAEMPLRASPGPLYEFACHEGNYSLPLILNGARAQERKETGAR